LSRGRRAEGDPRKVAPCRDRAAVADLVAVRRDDALIATLVARAAAPATAVRGVSIVPPGPNPPSPAVVPRDARPAGQRAPGAETAGPEIMAPAPVEMVSAGQRPADAVVDIVAAAQVELVVAEQSAQGAGTIRAAAWVSAADLAAIRLLRALIADVDDGAPPLPQPGRAPLTRGAKSCRVLPRAGMGL
jgi:hypothetical protein